MPLTIGHPIQRINETIADNLIVLEAVNLINYLFLFAYPS